jgi:hypothetical protein
VSIEHELAAWRLATSQGLLFPFRGQGLSMWPTLRPGDDALFRPISALPPTGTIVLASTPAGLVAHRLVHRRADGTVVLRGDALPGPDPPLAAGAVLGELTGVRRRGLTRPVPRHPYRLYHALAPVLGVVRRILARRRPGREDP